MRRIPSTLALAGWLGFVLVTVFLPVAPFIPTNTGAAVSWSPATGLVGSAVTAALIVAASLLVASLYLSHAPRRTLTAIAESLGALGLLLVGLVAYLAPLGGHDPFSANETSAPFWAMLVLAVAAIGFDRGVAIEAEGDDKEAEFEAAISAIAQGMARQTYLYSGSREDRSLDRKR